MSVAAEIGCLAFLALALRRGHAFGPYAVCARDAGRRLLGRTTRHGGSEREGAGAVLHHAAKGHTTIAGQQFTDAHPLQHRTESIQEHMW